MSPRIEVPMSELLIRASMNDHLVVGDLLAPTTGPRLARRRPSIDQLVADHLMLRQRLAEGVPLLGIFHGIVG